MLEFVGDAISLSGLTGTKPKCDVIGEYYRFWWGITSGGKSKDYRYPTAIVELNAATGEVYIKDAGETVLGSAGHALELKANSPHTNNLKVVLVEDDPQCYAHLKRTIKRRWPSVDIEEAERSPDDNSSNIYLLNKDLARALQAIQTLDLGNAIFFFDPLRSVVWSHIEEVAANRMRSFYETRTEFLIFLFTSDWFLGRDDFAPLPFKPDESSWSAEERTTIAEADSLLGNREWRTALLSDDAIEQRSRTLVESYKRRLWKWFRYVLPLPFNPKSNQLFHLILCSNYEAGVRMTRNEYSARTSNPRFSPDNSSAFRSFKNQHPGLFAPGHGRGRPLQWKVLWSIIATHEDGRCDWKCRDFTGIDFRLLEIKDALQWLAAQGYLELVDIPNAWDPSVESYRLNWGMITRKLGVEPPSSLVPLSLGQVSERNSVSEVSWH
jgi:three-Cys-motif partner protein